MAVENNKLRMSFSPDSEVVFQMQSELKSSLTQTCFETFCEINEMRQFLNVCDEPALSSLVLVEPLGLSFYLCLCTRVMACICVSPYVRGLGSGTQEYTHWNAKSVFWASIGRGMSPKLTRVCVMSNNRWRVLMQGAPRGLLFTATCVCVHKCTRNHIRQPVCLHSMGAMCVF